MRADPLEACVDSAAERELLAAALESPFRRAVRVHPRRGGAMSMPTVAAVPWSHEGLLTADDADPAGFLAYHSGAIYPQDAASQVPVQLLDPRPGETVIDACAAPGSKSTQIGLRLGDEGLLVCCDASDARRRILVENLARQGVGCAVVTPMPVERLAQQHLGCADALLVDAPCSGHELRSQRQVERMAQRQLALLTDSAALVRPGGRLVYSTCTPYQQENEGVITAFLVAHPHWHPHPVTLAGCDADRAGLGGVRLWPHRQGSEPFFAIRLDCSGDEPTRDSLTGVLPPRTSLPWGDELPWYTWQRNRGWFGGSARAAACALPSDGRAMLLGFDQRLEPWGAQALIERGAAHQRIPHAEACALWAGTALSQALPSESLIATDDGLPLGQLDRSGTRLAMPSRLHRQVR